MDTQDWRRLNDLAERLETAWSTAEDVDLAQFLPPVGDPLRCNVLQELIQTDLEIRWRRKQGRPLEFYLALFPELGPPAALPPKLIYEEYRVRCRHGDRPELTLYQERYPDQFAQVQKLLQQDPVATVPSNNSTPAAPPPRNGSVRPMEASQTTQILGGYTLEKLIGRGGFGEVWRATAPGGFPAAVKIITRPADHEERIREQRSLSVIKSLNHHFLIKTIASYSEEDRLYIIMDLADSSLRDRLKQCKTQKVNGVPVEELLRYFRESAEALDYLHEQDVLHRDIKPDNILLVGNHVRLADFGLARHQEQILASASGAGTPAYMAPEIWRGKASKHSDQYSLAYTYAELRLGHRAFTGTDYASVMFDHLDNTPNLEPLAEPEKKVLLKALAKKPEERYPTCVAFIEALEDVFGAVPRGSRPVPTIGSKAGSQTMRKAPDQPPTLESARATEHLSVAAGLQQTEMQDLNSLLPHQRGETKNTTLPLPTLGKDIAPRRRRGVLPFVIVGLLFVAVLGGFGALIVPGLLSKPEEVKPNPDTPPIVEPPQPATPWLPEHYKAAEKSPLKTDFRQVPYYQRIVADFPGVPPATFVLIPQERESDLPSYYLMENKVWNGLCGALAKKQGKIANRWPTSGAEADLPAFGLTAEEADTLAHLLGGLLPTTKQWDKAAGFEAANRPTEFVGGPQAAVNRRDKGPRSVTDHSSLSAYEIADMGGNGTEFTRNLVDGKTVPWPDAPSDALVILRGQRYTAPAPLKFTDLAEQQTMPQVQFYNARSPFTSFRIVLEPR